MEAGYVRSLPCSERPRKGLAHIYPYVNVKDKAQFVKVKYKYQDRYCQPKPVVREGAQIFAVRADETPTPQIRAISAPPQVTVRGPWVGPGIPKTSALCLGDRSTARVRCALCSRQHSGDSTWLRQARSTTHSSTNCAIPTTPRNN